MKIGYFADGPWSHEAINLISNCRDFEIVFIVPRFDTQDPILKEWAENFNIPFLPHKNVNSQEFLDKIEKYDADILVSMSFNQILKKTIINFPRLGFINCHAGALPFYRGRNPLNWVLINGESRFGITVHYVDEGIDTGDIIEQRFYPISIKDTYGSLLDQAVSQCAVVLYAALEKIKNGTVDATVQSEIHPIGTYFGMRKIGDEFVDFSWSSDRLHNFIRAITSPGPCARFFLSGQQYGIIASSIIDNAPKYISTIGEVVGKGENGIDVKTGDSSLRIEKIFEVNDDGEGNEFVPSFRIGARLSGERF